MCVVATAVTFCEVVAGSRQQIAWCGGLQVATARSCCSMIRHIYTAPPENNMGKVNDNNHGGFQ